MNEPPMGDIEELREDIRVLLDSISVMAREYAAVSANLVLVQTRCNELMEENRKLKAGNGQV